MKELNNFINNTYFDDMSITVVLSSSELSNVDSFNELSKNAMFNLFESIIFEYISSSSFNK